MPNTRDDETRAALWREALQGVDRTDENLQKVAARLVASGRSTSDVDRIRATLDEQT